jgi:hypothetical protein
MAERDMINDNHVPSRPGWIVYIGMIVIVVGVIAIMLANKVTPPVKTGAHEGASSSATFMA